jgi:hypothetical protein
MSTPNGSTRSRRGTLVDVGVIDQVLSGFTAINDSVIQAQLRNDIAASRLPAPSSSTLYLVFTPPNVTVPTSLARSSFDTLGFHNAFAYSLSSVVDYTVIKYQVGNDTVSSLSTFQSLILTITRELANSVTDSQGTGWIDPSSVCLRARNWHKTRSKHRASLGTCTNSNKLRSALRRPNSEGILHGCEPYFPP